MKARPCKRTIQELVEDFALSVIEQDKQINIGNARAGNVAARRRVNTFKQLCACYGDSGRDALVSLFEHENDSVRVDAAAYLLRHCTGKALGVLRDIAQNGKGFAKMGAFYSIKNWEEGTWQLDPATDDSTQENAKRK